MKTYAEIYKSVVRCTLEVPDDFTPEYSLPTKAVLITDETGIPTPGDVFSEGKFYKPGKIQVVISPELKAPLTQDQRDIILIKMAEVHGIIGV